MLWLLERSSLTTFIPYRYKPLLTTFITRSAQMRTAEIGSFPLVSLSVWDCRNSGPTLIIALSTLRVPRHFLSVYMAKISFHLHLHFHCHRAAGQIDVQVERRLTWWCAMCFRSTITSYEKGIIYRSAGRIILNVKTPNPVKWRRVRYWHIQIPSWSTLRNLSRQTRRLLYEVLQTVKPLKSWIIGKELYQEKRVQWHTL